MKSSRVVVTMFKDEIASTITSHLRAFPLFDSSAKTIAVLRTVSLVTV